MKRTILGTLMLSSALIFGAHWAAQPTAMADDSANAPEVGVGQGARLPRIAITADGKLGEILRKNAQLSSGFEVLERKSIPSSLVRAKSYDPTAWTSVGADVVVIVDDSNDHCYTEWGTILQPLKMKLEDWLTPVAYIPHGMLPKIAPVDLREKD